MHYDPNQVYEADYRVRDDGQIEQAPPRRQPSRLKGLLGPLGAALLFLATKFKFVLAALKGVKFLGTGFTALLSVGAYALLFPWQFAVGLVVLIFIHELGHVVVLRRYGVPATAPIFIPFMGAYIGMKQLPKNAVMEAYVGLGGPIIGSLAAFAAYGVYRANGSELFLALAYIGVLLNLFNLLPILPLDGGRAVGAISRWFWVAGFAGLIALLFIRPSPILLLILLFGAPEVLNAIRNRGDNEYYRVTAADRLTIAAIYFGLLFVLGFSMYELQHLMVENRP
jgi:Zn-dependent protease